MRTPATASLALLVVASAAAGGDSPDEPEATLRAYIEVWNNGKLEQLDDLVTEDFHRHAPNGAATSREQLKRIVAASRSFYPDLRIEIDDALAGGDRGVVRSRFTGTYGGDRFLLVANSISMFQLRDGKLSDEWLQGNTLDLWTSAGYGLSPPGSTLVPPPFEVTPGPFPADRRLGSAALATFLERAAENASSSAGALEIESSVACRVNLDGRWIGGIGAGERVILPVERGRHLLRFASLGGTVFFERAVEVGRREQLAVTAEAPARMLVRPIDRTTEDLQTGLMWQLTDNGENIGLAGARALCETLQQGGHGDWRLPSIFELQSLYSEETTAEKRYHSLDGVTLSDCCPWTDTPQEGLYWTYVFHMGMLHLAFEGFPWHMRALCVRDPAGDVRGESQSTRTTTSDATL